MRGHPLLEFWLVLGLGGMLLFPLWVLVRPIEPASATVPVSSTATMEGRDGWLTLRLSHAPSALEVRAGETILYAGSGETRWEGSAYLPIDGDQRLVLQVTVEWLHEVDQPYLEIAVEPSGWPARQRGFWARSGETRTFALEW